jgi:hypothetical protein
MHEPIYISVHSSIFIMRYVAYNYGCWIPLEVDYRLRILFNNLQLIHLDKDEYVKIEKDGYHYLAILS